MNCNTVQNVMIITVNNIISIIDALSLMFLYLIASIVVMTCLIVLKLIWFHSDCGMTCRLRKKGVRGVLVSDEFLFMFMSLSYLKCHTHS